MSSDAIQKCRDEQLRCAENYANPELSESDRKLAMLGVSDWMHEELLSEDGYQAFLRSKRVTAPPAGFEPTLPINPMLFDFQRDVVRWCIRRGKSALFADCGLGKTPMQLEWARHVAEHTGKPVLILAPLAVSHQTKREGEKFGIEVGVARHVVECLWPVNVTNYEKLDHFNPKPFGGIVLDESSCIKAHDRKTRQMVQDFAASIPYRLCCTATPAPNDHMELGTHAEFLGVMTRAEMLAMFFTHDGGETSKWRLKGHAEDVFWKWVASWAIMMRKPSDLGYPDGDFILPPIRHEQHTVKVGENFGERLFAVEAQTLTERRNARRDSLPERVKLCADLVNASTEPWIVWCNLNAESEALTKAIPGAIEVTGSDAASVKEERLLGFQRGDFRVLVSKASIAGWGLNLQLCSKIAFVGLSDSFEELYQATRRCWRFGQTKPVDVHVIVGELEGAVVRNIQRKERQAEEMAEGMVKHMAEINSAAVHGLARDTDEYERDLAQGDRWKLHLGDSAEVLRDIPSDSIHYQIFSPPFASLYTYSNSERDMGNVKDHKEFFAHYRWLAKEQFRITMPGRLLSFHCMNLPKSKERDGVIGITDFRGDVIRIYEDAGFVLHSEVVIWKDPVTAMQRTKALGLLHKQIKKDSCMSRQGIPDYLVTMRKDGKNPEPVADMFDRYVGAEGTGPRGIGAECPACNGAKRVMSEGEWYDCYCATENKESRYSIEVWQRYASPVWMDINPSDTLQRQSAREDDDERHICPLQLQVIERALELWTNEGDTVLSPFAGIGSEGYVALKQGRQFIGCELKRSYWEQARRNLENASNSGENARLF